MSPAVSVVVPVHDGVDHIGATVESVLAQTLADLELIVVDDGSTDGTAEVLAALAAAHPRVRVIAQPNGGPGRARNTGADAARGDWLYFLDSDDLLAPEALERLVARAREDDAQIVYFVAEPFTDEPGQDARLAAAAEYYRRHAEYPSPASGRDHLVAKTAGGDWRPAPGLQLFDRRWYASTGTRFPEGVLHEDNLFAVEVALRAERVSDLPVTLFRRRIRAGSITTGRKRSGHVLGLVRTAVELGRLSAEAGTDSELREALGRLTATTHRLAADSYGRLREAGGDLGDLLADPETAALLPLYDRQLELTERLTSAEERLAELRAHPLVRLLAAPRRLVARWRGGTTGPRRATTP